MRKGPLALVLLFAVAAAFLAGTWVAHRSASKGGDSGGRKVLYYVDPMHPAYKSDKPGIAPDCGMQLEPVYADGSTGGGSSPGTPGTVTLLQEKRQAIGVAVGKAEKAPWTGTLRLLGRVVPDEARTYRLNAPLDIRLRKVYTPTTGSFVKKDQPLAAYFSSGYLVAANTFVNTVAGQTRSLQSTVGSQVQAQYPDYQRRQAAGALINMGVSESQILDMEKTGKVIELVEVRSPADGFVLERSVSEGQFASVGSELYRIADLGKVWILAETYESEGKLLRPGMEVKATHPQTKRTYRARVTEILPQFDPQTRTMKVRLETDNPGYSLRPDMFVDLEIPVRMPPAVTVPVEAVIDAGTRKTVFVDRGEGRFEPRPVETGWRMGGRVEIVRGLMPGESIVVSGNFLVDSESRMQLAAAGIYGAWHVDPVCGMHVDEGKAKAAGKTVDHGGKTYYFCSDDCMARFRGEPAKYLKEAGPTAKKETPKPAPQAHGRQEKHAAPAAAGAQKEEAAAESDDLPIDPVCGMVVDPMTARAANRVSEHKGKTYYFCADMCKQRFDANPATYLAKPGQGGMAPSDGRAETGDTPLSTPPAKPPIPASPAEKRKIIVPPPGPGGVYRGINVDPVCGNTVEAGRVSVYKGATYHFCDESCKRRFDANPTAFLAKPDQGGTAAEQTGHGEHGKDAHGGHGK
ncbi:MAG: efflux transporter, family, subunit [Deltaproteobacteria bacterium]|jgi:RND family efflux transporter MFP subunit|nr:efflux transporter, family, subunit [Deltaproteobacteria bacterium]